MQAANPPTGIMSVLQSNAAAYGQPDPTNRGPLRLVSVTFHPENSSKMAIGNYGQPDPYKQFEKLAWLYKFNLN